MYKIRCPSVGFELDLRSREQALFLLYPLAAPNQHIVSSGVDAALLMVEAHADRPAKAQRHA